LFCVKLHLLPNDFSQFYKTTLFVLKLFQSQFIDLIVVFDGMIESAKINEKQNRRMQQWKRVENILGIFELAFFLFSTTVVHFVYCRID
jgi:ABC-type multidrug transport system permease subunit